MTEYITKRAQIQRTASDLLDPNEDHGPRRSLHTVKSGDSTFVYHEDDIDELTAWSKEPWPDTCDMPDFTTLVGLARDAGLLYVAPTARELMLEAATLIPGSLMRFHVGLQFQDVHRVWHSCFKMVNPEGYATGIRNYAGQECVISWLPPMFNAEHGNAVSRFIAMCERNLEELHAVRED